ncbi:MAG TPA: tRNA (adenosine(37)-N6)-threonylcarbamoyltransferase complex dimerization subunit type 1 TsaB [Nitrospira sp.]|nr:tRNA (adenosine(37)-N6)-threonylcarbamoyltransferase complex dimerization subunit type 1 TsaB [Nitrospira sp.]
MKILAVETATAWQSVAILDGDRVLARYDQDAAGSHAKLLLPAIDRLFKSTGLSPARLEGLAVSIGPGSFTGLRVGLATMLGFRTITQLPLAVVPTLEGMAWNLRGTSLPLCPVLNSRRGELYWALFQWVGQDRIERIVLEQVGPPAALGKQLSGQVVLYGEGWITEQAAIRAAMTHPVTMTETTVLEMKPSAVSIGLAGIARLQRGERAGIGVSPLYVQRPEAELRYEQSGGISPVARRQEKVARKLKNRLALAGARMRRKG